MAETQLAHRIVRETKISNGLLAQSERGQHYALTVCLSALVGAVVLALTNHETTASIIGGLDLVALAVVFIAGKTLPSQKNKRATDEE